jgi:hypothetical protein
MKLVEQNLEESNPYSLFAYAVRSKVKQGITIEGD